MMRRSTKRVAMNANKYAISLSQTQVVRDRRSLKKAFGKNADKLNNLTGYN